MSLSVVKHRDTSMVVEVAGVVSNSYTATRQSVVYFVHSTFTYIGRCQGWRGEPMCVSKESHARITTRLRTGYSTPLCLLTK